MIAVSGVTTITPNPGRSFLGWLASVTQTSRSIRMSLLTSVDLQVDCPCPGPDVEAGQELDVLIQL